MIVVSLGHHGKFFFKNILSSFGASCKCKDLTQVLCAFHLLAERIPRRFELTLEAFFLKLPFHGRVP